MKKFYFLFIILLCLNSHLDACVEIIEGTIYFYPWPPTLVGKRDPYKIKEVFDEEISVDDRLCRAVISSGKMRDMREYRNYSFIPQYFPIKFFHDENGEIIYDTVQIGMKGKIFRLRLVCTKSLMQGYGFSSPDYFLQRLMWFLRSREPQLTIE